MIVVSNAGPLIALGKLGRLDLLESLYGAVLVPQQVHEETVLSGKAHGAADAAVIADSFERGDLQSRGVELDKLLAHTEIQKGEQATIELALLVGADLALIDDAAARDVAHHYHLCVKGTLGVIVEAFKRSIVVRGEAMVMVEQLKHRKDIWISNHLCEFALDQLKD